ncbi:MAG: family 10 glycosylhydrolase [Ruminococcus sp.]|nr:family 10 glycosylhydrolase [Ruminococcus sp.]
MKFKRITPFLLSFLILCVSVCFAGRHNEDSITPSSEPTQPSFDVSDAEMRGVWISYMTLDTENAENIEEAICEKTERIIDIMKSASLNTMIVQVRPFADALYRSSYYPWSHILTGEQGEDPGFDPLAVIIEKAHSNGIAVHAWVNPYRVKTAETPSELCEDSPFIQSPEICKEHDGAVYLDPSDESARKLITEGVREIADKYAVDGIQFDDYFYPTADESFDKEEYEAYTAEAVSPLSLSDWRKENVNTLIRDVYRAIHQANDNIVFGISPQGNYANNDSLSADVASWCEKEGYIDYICPQIYFSLDNPALTFEKGLADWLDQEKHPALKLYAGIACYKAGSDADEGTWLDNDDIIRTEVEIVRESAIDGFMLYSIDSFEKEDCQAEIEHLKDYLNSSPKQ